MKPSFIRRQLRRYPWRLFLVSLGVLPVFSLLLFSVVTHQKAGGVRWFLICLLFGIAILCLLGVVVLGAWRLFRIDQHLDVQALARYGPPREVVAAIDAELAEGKQVTRVGQGLRSFQVPVRNELGYNEVYLTPSWLVHFSGPELSHVQVFHLDSLILAGRRGDRVVLADRHGVEAEIPGTDTGLTRLLAEILVRVPWALNRFDEETERTWRDDRDQIIAAVDRQRQDIRKPSPPPSPM
jgi:hypothetical protein